MTKFSGTKHRPLRANLTAPVRTIRDRIPTYEGGEAIARGTGVRAVPARCDEHGG